MKNHSQFALVIHECASVCVCVAVQLKLSVVSSRLIKNSLVCGFRSMHVWFVHRQLNCVDGKWNGNNNKNGKITKRKKSDRKENSQIENNIIAIRPQRPRATTMAINIRLLNFSKFCAVCTHTCFSFCFSFHFDKRAYFHNGKEMMIMKNENERKINC